MKILILNNRKNEGMFGINVLMLHDFGLNLAVELE